MLRTALGPAIARLLEDPSVVEVMLNPDGRLWVDRLSEGLSDTGEHLSPADGERIVRLVAHHVGVEVHANAPRVSAELPETGERFEGLLPPVVAAPAFAIRKPAVAVFTLADYVAAGIMAGDQAEAPPSELALPPAASPSPGPPPPALSHRAEPHLPAVLLPPPVEALPSQAVHRPRTASAPPRNLALQVWLPASAMSPVPARRLRLLPSSAQHRRPPTA